MHLTNLQTQFSQHQIFESHLPVLELVAIWGRLWLCGACGSYHNVPLVRFSEPPPPLHNITASFVWRGDRQVNWRAAWTQFDFKVGTDLNDNTCARIHVWCIRTLLEWKRIHNFCWALQLHNFLPKKIIVLCVFPLSRIIFTKRHGIIS
jgi:hypothetical protein